ncbi:laminin subunit beta-1-like isoform X2 [Tachypleus tridentatus]|uniref:laminin subunit beta-1-like isoform X2 n=1 Tax=Tachypleus tridentatus TaxID=6853 RepID=UPI003FD4BFB6
MKRYRLWGCLMLVTVFVFYASDVSGKQNEGRSRWLRNRRKQVYDIRAGRNPYRPLRRIPERKIGRRFHIIDEGVNDERNEGRSRRLGTRRRQDRRLHEDSGSGRTYRYSTRRLREERRRGRPFHVVGKGIYHQERPHPRACHKSSCYPAVGNLLIGREMYLKASSTCGQKRKERFCIVSHLKERKKCFICDSRRRRKSHEIENIVSRFGGTRLKWWQAENGKEDVTIQLDLEAEFHFTHLIILFKTFRPAAMLIERSYDFGRTWKVYQYFAYNCAESFPGIPLGPRQRVGDVVCDNRYSGVAPSTEGEVIFKVLPPNIQVANPYSPEVQDLLKMTNLRINFTKLHTLGDSLLDSSKHIKMKYYYAIYEMVVRGSCSCYGHASQCVAERGQTAEPDMVYGKCQCTHYTKGLNCEQCQDFYNDLPWKPAIGNMTNACKRCNCNEHANKCHFDPAVWESTGRVSGGVCDGCQHNTVGRNCEQCKAFYFQDPRRHITDPSICQPCDCDPRGSLEEGNCEPRSDPANGIIAGTCHCKSNVEGRRCDHCKNGFWNFRFDNPSGCEPCNCNMLGIVGNHGCNEFRGECTCKRNVIGRHCDQCLSEFWGLGSDEVGCKPCSCDPGGAYDNNCDVVNGQCRCRPHVIGRQCDKPEPGYFAGNLDYLVYEAELTRGCRNCQVNVREPEPGKRPTWTGLGFMKVYEGSSLTFNISNLPQTLEYGIAIRYEHKQPMDWEKAVVIIERPGPIDQTGPCANTKPTDDINTVNLPQRERYIVVYPKACLEKGKEYHVRLELEYYNRQKDSPHAVVYIDSLALIPQIDRIPFFNEIPGGDKHREEFQRFRCGEVFFSVSDREPPEVCKKFFYSISFYVFGGGLKCDCDLTGSLSEQCDPLGGQCQCKPNVVGRRCDRCAPGAYGFGPKGCTSCSCHNFGSVDNFCDIETGQCRCRINTYGQHCDECQPGFWNYPNCRLCECNGHTEICDSRTGYCLECENFTTGPRCDRCISGYYGDPRSEVNIPCQPCPCPWTVENGINHARGCYLDAHTQKVICRCNEGYKGERCNKCADNYYGNPTLPGSKCQRCMCNDNIDITVPESCDSVTGECLLCMFNTEGPHCEYCKKGHYGNATQHYCPACICNPLGTDPIVDHCDSITGQCTCLPNVIGKACDQCSLNHWNLSSGEGCKSCSCDPKGSLLEDCNEFDGQCLCKKGRGGRTCSECEDYYWGDPEVQCFPCKCDFEGAASMQCRHSDGTCFCKKGVIGKFCDQCEQGYFGTAPNCNHCGECFDKWDYTIEDLKDQTFTLMEKFKEVNDTGTTGLYTKEFEEIETKLNEVQFILAGENVTKLDTSEIEHLLSVIKTNVTHSEAQLNSTKVKLDNTTQRIYDAELALTDLRGRGDNLEMDAESLKNNATQLQEADIEGAFNITKQAQTKSKAAEEQVENAQTVLDQSARLRYETEELLEQEQIHFNRTYDENVALLNNISDQAFSIDAGIADINRMVCDGSGTVDNCDLLCGGAGCRKCGGISCRRGAVTLVKNALDLAREAEDIISVKEAAADDLLNKMEKLNTLTNDALKEATDAFNTAKNTELQSGNTSADIVNLLDRIEEFLTAEGAQPAEIRVLAEECLSLQMSLGPEEIENLAHEITEIVKNLTNIDAILNDTAKDRKLAKDLEDRAVRAKNASNAILERAKDVQKAVEEAKKFQDQASTAISTSKEDIATAEKDLVEIENQTQETKVVTEKSQKEVDTMKDQYDELHKKYLKNQRSLKQAVQETINATDLAKKADSDAQLLEENYNKTKELLDEKALESDKIKARTEELKKKAKELAELATKKYQDFRKLEGDFERNNQTLTRYEETLDKLLKELEEALAVIKARSQKYRECT